MYYDEPRGEDVDDMVEEVGVAGTVEGGVERKHEEEDVGDIFQPVLGQRFAFSGYRE
jgi:hypothetical protein